MKTLNTFEKKNNKAFFKNKMQNTKYKVLKELIQLEYIAIGDFIICY